MSLLFPRRFRIFPYRRSILISLRSLHILCFSVLVGGLYFQQPAEFLTPWVAGVVITGLGLFGIDLYGSFITFFELRGITVVLKVLLLLLIPSSSHTTQWLILVTVILVSSLISHAPAKIRHWNIMPANFRRTRGLQTDEQES